MVGSACYRDVEFDVVRRWYPGESAAVRLTGSPYAEVVIRSKELEYVVVSLENGEPKIAAEFEYPAGELTSVSRWPPVAIDLDGDGLEEAVFSTLTREVHVLSHDADDGTYALEAFSDLLPEDTFYLHAILDVDLDGSHELIATTGTASDPEDTNMTVVDHVGGNWIRVGTPLLVPEISTGLIVTKPLAPDASDVPRLAYIHNDEKGYGTGVTIVRVTDGFELVKEAALDVEFGVTHFTSGDFAGSGVSDVHVLGYDDDAQATKQAFFAFDSSVWVRQESPNRDDLYWGAAGDMTGDGSAELLALSVPMRAVSLSENLDTPLLEGAVPLGVHELSGDELGDLVYRPLPDASRTSTPTSLHFLISFD